MVVAPAQAQAAANEAAQAWDEAITQEELEASARTFGGAGFSASGAAPPTHYGCSTVLSETGIAIAEDEIAALPSGVHWGILTGPEPSGVVASTNLAGVQPGAVLGFAEMLAALGLAPVEAVG